MEQTEFLKAVVAYIRNNFSTVTRGELSREFFVSADYLNRVFKKEFSVTISQYIILEKICNFEKIVMDGECAKNACKKCGFGNYSNFIRTYKKYRGYTPGEYVKGKM